MRVQVLSNGIVIGGAELTRLDPPMGVAMGHFEPQGCSTLQMSQFRQRFQAAESGAISILTEGAGSIGLEDIEAEAAESGEHARVAAYA